MGEHSDQGETKQPYALLPRYGNGDASEEQPEAGDTDEDVETTGEYYDKYVASEILTLAASTKDPRVQDLYERACRINDMHHIVRTCIHAIMIQELGYTKCLKTLLPELSDSLDEELDRIEDEASYLMTAYYESLDSDGIEEGKVIPLITEGESHHGSEDDVNQLPFTNI